MNKLILKILLKVHSFCYNWASYFAKRVEPEGIHPKHRLMNYHQFFLDNVLTVDRVIDVGCGKGEIAYDVAAKAAFVLGVDLKEEKIEWARKNLKRDNLEYRVADALADLPNQRFDVVIISNILEHFEDRTKFLEGIKKLAPKILIRVPMINRDWITLYKKELGLNWRLHNEHYIEYTKETFYDEMRKANLTIVDFSVQFGEVWAIVKNEQV